MKERVLLVAFALEVDGAERLGFLVAFAADEAVRRAAEGEFEVVDDDVVEEEEGELEEEEEKEEEEEERFWFVMAMGWERDKRALLCLMTLMSVLSSAVVTRFRSAASDTAFFCRYTGFM